MAKYRLTNPAAESLQQITKYTNEKWGATQRRKYIKALYDRFDYLAENPDKGKSRGYLRKDLFSHGEGSHVVYYRIKKSHIEIINILHNRMDPERHLS